MTTGEIAIVAGLLDERLKDALVQKIYQPSPRRLVLQMHAPRRGKVSLLIDLTVQAAKILVTERKLPNPQQAPAFCLALRKLLENGRVKSVRAVPDDRILHIVVDRKVDEVIEARTLVVELLPHRPLLFVTDARDTVLLVHSAVHDPNRELARGQTWTPPAAAPSGRTEREPFSRFVGWSPDQIFALMDEELSDDLETGIDRKALAKAVAKAVERQFKKIAKVESDARRVGDEALHWHRGELLKSALNQASRGMTEIRVRDWGVEGEIYETIPLDPLLNPVDNLEAIFHEAKKCQRGREIVQARLEEQRLRLAELQELAELLQSDAPEALDRSATIAESLGIDVPKIRETSPKAKRSAPEKRLPYKSYQSKDGLEIRVGRSSRDNDDLTFHHARGNDWWLHAQDYAGSHVVVPIEDELPSETLIDAATLAIEYSKAHSGGKQSVSYTRRKHVGKFKGAKPGQVTLKEHKTVLVRFEPERLARLLQKPLPGSPQK